MAKFGQNYRGGKEKIVCPLCESHLDNQELSYICPVIRNECKCSSDIYSEEIHKNTVETIEKIVEIRKSMLDE